ncbi:hypothetical protein GSI_15469 [Ganoderma sinense ZZ0214-1]|uniref:Uncharacterized protein n=1 Tax=Ganoderma sinense ZZ0214-1 TaxID=1077348 RepID=A0A2G8RMN1_9APHY|nr:hypothetical protein GSI_15469 [Ganoderma sinense ZZ0214-1]
MLVPLPSPESLAHRARIAALLAPLRPTQFRAPLTRLEAHRIPTLWTLYRGILRDAPDEVIRSRMRAFFRVRQKMRVQGDVVRELRKAHKARTLTPYPLESPSEFCAKWWDMFQKARAGDQHFAAVCARYSRMLDGARLQRRADAVYQEELDWYERMRTRPIMTGGYLRPTLFNKGLPRLVPQPQHISGMITSRRRARERRIARFDTMQEYANLLYTEFRFEDALATAAERGGQPIERVFTEDTTAWRQPLDDLLKDLSKSFDRERARQLAPYPPEMLAAIKEARREKIRNKTRERERWRRGEVTNRLRRLMNQGPPAHVLSRMTAEQRRMDRIARSPSEVGYVAKVKRQLGHKLRDDETWRVELGRQENQESLDRMEEEIEGENARRRTPMDETVPA